MSEFYDMKKICPQMKNHRIGTIMLENDNKIAKKKIKKRIKLGSSLSDEHEVFTQDQILFSPWPHICSTSLMRVRTEKEIN